MPCEHICLSFRDIIDSLRSGDYSVASSRLNEALLLIQSELKTERNSAAATSETTLLPGNTFHHAKNGGLGCSRRYSGI